MGLFEHKNVHGEEFSFHLSPHLERLWSRTNLKSLKKTNQDRVYIVDGREGTGKSTWALQQAAALEPGLLDDPKEFASRIVFSPEAFLNAARNVKNGVIIFDEAFRGMSSRAALSKTNKELVQSLMEMRQQNNIVFLILPSIFLLDIYPAMFRSNGLFNMYINKKSQKRCWRFYNYNDKNSIYQMGLKKGWKYVLRSPWKGNFYNNFPKGNVLEAYIDKKEQAFKEKRKEEIDGETPRTKIELQRDFYLYNLYLQLKKEKNITQRDFVKLFQGIADDKLVITQGRLSQIIGKLREKGHLISISD